MGSQLEPEQKGSKSGHKYKKSLILQETTIQLVKKSSEIYPKSKDPGMSTERLSKDHHRKRSIDCGTIRVKTEMDDQRPRQDSVMVEISVEDLREAAGKLLELRSERRTL